jgi:RES domain-containing protein
VSVTCWRLTKRKHAAAAFTGEGARLYGGRWNSPGVPMIYTAETQSLAALEMLVHLDAPALLDRYVLMEVQMEENLVLRLDPKDWPKDWRQSPPPARLREIGDAWIEAAKSAALRVPSALVPGEGNFLLNPRHENFAQVRIGKALPFHYDPRLAKHRSP